MLIILAFGFLFIACGGEQEAPAAKTETDAATESEAQAGESAGYAGETIEIIVPYGEGGGFDT